MELANTLRKREGTENVLKHLVVDSGAIITGERLEHLAENFWTVQEVIEEIRDSRSRHVLSTAPFHLNIRCPSAEAVSAVSAFAKKTGDYRVLSLADIKVLALTYMLEKEECGGVNHLNAEPCVGDKEIAQFPSNLSVVETDEFSVLGTRPSVSPTVGLGTSSNELLKPDKKHFPLSVDSASPSQDETLIISGRYSSRLLNASHSNASNPNPSSSAIWNESIEDNGIGWIGSHNMNTLEHSSWDTSGQAESSLSSKVNVLNRAVGCITVDFAMQNVLLQLGLGLYSAKGIVITALKRWVLRCFACSHITSEMNKLFCPRCGNATMTKLSFYLDSRGQRNYGFKKNFILKKRGTIFPIPKCKGGRHDKRMLLREDQLMTGLWQKMDKKSVSAESSFDDYGFAQSLLRYPRTSVDVGVGRKNPNAQRGRERRGKKKKRNQRFF